MHVVGDWSLGYRCSQAVLSEATRAAATLDMHRMWDCMLSE